MYCLFNVSSVFYMKHFNLHFNSIILLLQFLHEAYLDLNSFLLLLFDG